MNFENLNKVAAKYTATQTEELFAELYAEVIATFRKMNRVRIARSGYGDDADADTILDGVLLRVIKREKPTENFGSLMLISLRNAQLDFFKTEKRRRARYILSLDSDALTLEIADSVDVESEYYRKKKKAEQRELLDSLTNVDDYDTTRIVSQFSQYTSITALAKALDMHHESVRRKLRRLSRQYDANRFGEVSEYLAV